MTNEEFLSIVKKNPVSVSCGLLALICGLGVYFRSDGLPAAEILLEQNQVEVQPPGKAQEREVVALATQCEDLRAVRAEMDVDWRATTARAADLKQMGVGSGSHELARLFL